MTLDAIVDAIRTFPGVTRKRTIQDVVKSLPTAAFANVAASEGEDAAAIEYGNDYLLFAADGIMESLVKTNPYYAGYFAVLVNVNDIAAMGGKAIAMVDILSMKDEKICGHILRGMERAVQKFNVPIVGGHTHPDCAYHAIDVSIMGVVPKDQIIRSDTACDGDDIVFVMDTDGFFPPDLKYAWDTTTKKDDKLVQDQMAAMCTVAQEHLSTAGKDMSNPGCIGTLGMLLESSCMGGTVDIDKIPRPANEDLIQWILTYQGCGFVLTCPPENSKRILDIFKGVKVDGAVVGKVDSSKKLKLTMRGDERVLFDFSTDIITGCRPKKKKV